MFQIGPYKIETPYLLAPMAGVSEMPFRVLALEKGAGLCTTELISSKGIFFENLRTQQYLQYNKEKELPYSVQLFGGDEETMAAATRFAYEKGAQIVDINMGCPVKKVTKTGSGSALMIDIKRAASLVCAMRKATDDQVPITVKIRSGWDETNLNFIELSKALEDAGCAAIALHARTRAQAYRGHANWNQIAQLKDALSIPVIGNGDVLTPDDARRMQKQTGCDAVMIGRGALGNPWVFTALQNGLKHYEPSPSERLSVVSNHFESHLCFHMTLFEEQKAKEKVPPKNSPELRAIRTFKNHLVWYAKELYGASAFREKVMTCEDLSQVRELIESFFKTAQKSNAKILSDDAIDYRKAHG